MKLIDNAKDAWKFLSVQISVVIATIGFAEPYLPALKEALPPGWYAIAAVLVIAGRVIKQSKDDPH